MSRSTSVGPRRIIRREQHILATGMWTAPAAMLPGSLVATVISGGDSGGRANGINGTATGGNGGAVLRRRLADVAPGSTQPVVVGSGGTGTTLVSTKGTSGGPSRFGSVQNPTPTEQSGIASDRTTTAEEGAGQATAYTTTAYINPTVHDSDEPPYAGAGAGTWGGLNLVPAGRGGGTCSTYANDQGDARNNSGGGGGGGSSARSGNGGSGRVILEWEEYAA